MILRLIGLAALLTAAAGCGSSSPHVAKASATPPGPTTTQGLRAALLTQAELPAGFVINPAPAETVPGGDGEDLTPGTSLDAMTCGDLFRVDFLSIHLRPIAEAASGIERQPSAADDDGWFGQENIDLYTPGQAVRAMDSIRRVAARCTSFTDTSPDSTNVLKVTAVSPVGADDGMILSFVLKLAVDDAPMTMQTAFVRSGDVILTVTRTPAYKSPDDVTTILSPAWAAYRKRR